jgi:transcriptional regulator with XRE-family HTH domain
MKTKQVIDILGITESDIAEVCNISRQAVSWWRYKRDDEVPDTHLEQLANYFPLKAERLGCELIGERWVLQSE